MAIDASSKVALDSYIRLRCHIPSEVEEELPELLAPWPVLGAEIGQARDGWVPIAVYALARFQEALEGAAVVLSANGAREFDAETLEEEDWLAGFRGQACPFAVGELWWIDPQPDHPTPAPGGRHHLQIEPRMAFGSGSHESTQLMLLAMEELEISGASVLDVGTGSGILALAADCLGARSVVAVDIDETAVWVARETSNQQGWSPHLQFAIGSMSCIGGGGFDIVLCNMITANFVPLLESIRGLLGPDGVVVLAGLLVVEIDGVKEALTTAGLAVRSERLQGEWASVVAIPESGE